MTDGVLRIGVIGAGANTKTLHIPKLQNLEGVEVVAVANRTLLSAQKVCDELSIKRAVKDWRDIIGDKEIDAVVFGTWPYLHRTLILLALQAGKHVLTEARLTTNATEAREVLQASREQPHLVAQVVPSPVTFKWDKTIQDIIACGKLGDLIHIEVESITGKFPDEDGSPLHWRQDERLSGRNIMSMGIFYEPLQRWVGDASSVTALARTVVKRRSDPATGAPEAVHVPDHIDILCNFAIGAQGRITISTVLGSRQRSSFTIYGKTGTLHLDVTASKLTLAQKGGDAQEITVQPEDEYSWHVEEEWINSIRSGAPVRRTDFTSGVRYMEFTEAVSLSLQQQRTIHLPLLK